MLETGHKPLYAKVRETLIARMAEGQWKAGEALPSEFALADELGVSQGTVRKALNAMAAENIVTRHQGRGTYVPEHTEARALFHFFRLIRADGSSIVPELRAQTIERIEAPSDIAKVLSAGRRKLWRISRLRAVDGRPALIEDSYLDPKRFDALRPDTTLPNALYSFYQSAAGVTVALAEDMLSAVSATPAQADQLDVAPGTPLLKSHRLARDLRGEAVELRLSWFLTEGIGYRVDLR